jgi:hypothetical protein
VSVGQELQAAIHAVLTGSAALMALVPGGIHDGNPPDSAGFPRITYGPADSVPQQLQGVAARLDTVQIDVWSRINGELYEAKAILDAIEALLNGVDLPMGQHAVASCEVTLLRVFKDPDRITAHGVVQVEAMVERR